MEKKENQEEKKENKDKKDKKENGSDNEEEDPKLEKPSYTYWKRDSDKAADHTQFHPQPAAPIKESQPQVNKIASCWNKAGTWEEKKLNKNQVEEFFNGKMKETPFTYKDAFKLDKIHSYSGDVNNNYLILYHRHISYFLEEK